MADQESVTVELDVALGERDLRGCLPLDEDDDCRDERLQRLSPARWVTDREQDRETGG